jgi:hypothetical protein
VEESEIRTDWDIVITPNADGTVTSRHLGLTVEGAVIVLRQILADLEGMLPPSPAETQALGGLVESAESEK